MDENSITSDQIRVEISGLLTRRHRLVGGGLVVGELTFGPGLVVPYTDAEGRQGRMERASLWRGEHRLRKGDRVVASALVRPLRRRTEVRFGERTFTLYPRDFWLRDWELENEEGKTVLAAQRVGWGQTEIAILDPVDSDLVAFAYYLALVRRRAARRTRLG